MPSWSDDEGRFYWAPPDRPFYERVEIPHAPVTVQAGCTCKFCSYSGGAPSRYTIPEKILDDIEDLLRNYDTALQNVLYKYKQYNPLLELDKIRSVLEALSSARSA
jgi:hypothetical protein